MALILRKAICDCPYTPLIQAKRFRGKINIQRPKPPHFEKAKFLALAKPWFENKPSKETSPPLIVCTKNEIPPHKLNVERNIYQELIAEQVRKRLESSKLVAICHYNPMLGEQRFEAFVAFYKAQMHIEQFGKQTMQLAVKDSIYETIMKLFVSHNILIFSPEPELKTMLKILKKFPQLVLLAGIYEKQFLSKDELLHYSKIPSLQIAQAQLVHCLNSIGGQLVGHLNSHQSTLVSHLEQRAEQLQEKDR